MEFMDPLIDYLISCASLIPLTHKQQIATEEPTWRVQRESKAFTGETLWSFEIVFCQQEQQFLHAFLYFV